MHKKSCQVVLKLVIVFFCLAVLIGVAIIFKESVAGMTAKSINYIMPSVWNEYNKNIVWDRESKLFPKYYQNIVQGYANKHSIFPGEEFSLFLAIKTNNNTCYGLALIGKCTKKKIKGTVEIYRIGNYDGKDRMLVSSIPNVILKQQRIHAADATIGTSWSPTISVTSTENWKTGYYTINFKADGGQYDKNIAYIVVKNPESNGDILVKLSTNTYQAYNSWGGHSFYRSPHGLSMGQVVSFDRPTPPFFFVWEYYYVLWLEKFAAEKNLTIDYATDFDLHSDPSFSLKYPLLISVGHDEYWSQQEFMNIYKRIYVYGKNTMFLGANTAYWRVRFADINQLNGQDLGRELICYKNHFDPISTRTKKSENEYSTGLFRDNGLPETMLMGIAYEGYFTKEPHQNSYYAINTKLPIFKNTGFNARDKVPHIIGYEWDNRDPEADEHYLRNKKGGNKLAIINNKSIYVLFSGIVKGSGVRLIHGKRDYGIAEAVYFKADSGAKVFSAGTIRWPWALTKKGYINKKFIKFNENLVMDFLDKLTMNRSIN